ncbi:MAG: hypothetical protein JRN39_00265 [Nitrososphaerota archaeon]|nr:hypothetical protein [Nitrososphaerota archaeon]
MPQALKVGNCAFPDDALFDVENGTWVRLQGGTAVVGVTSVLGWLSGRLTAVSFKERGRLYQRGKGLGTVEGPRHFEVVRSPLTGTAVDFNAELTGRPWLVNKDPYGAAWFAKVRPAALEEEAGVLLDAGAAAAALGEKIAQLRVRCFDEFPDVEMFEVGSGCSAVLVRLNDIVSKAEVGTVVHVVSDEPTAWIEMVRWSDQTGQALVETREEKPLTHFLVKKVTEWKTA